MSTAPEFKKGLFAALDLLWPFRRKLALVLGLGVLIAITTAFIPYLVGRFLDALQLAAQTQTPNDVQFAFITLALWFGVQMANHIIGWTNRHISRELPEAFQASVHSRVLTHLMRLPMMFHKQHRLSAIRDIQYRAANLGVSTINTGTDVMVGLLSVLFSIAVAFTIHSGLAWLLVVSAVVYTVIMFRTVRATAPLHRDGQKAWARAMGEASLLAQHIDAVKIAAAENKEETRIKDSFRKAVLTWLRMENVWSRIDAFQRAVIFTTMSIIFGTGIWLVLKGEISIGDLVAFNGYAAMFLGPLIRVGYSWQRIQNATAAALELKEKVFDQKTEVYEPEGAVSLRTVRGDVQFDNVAFRYGDGDTDVLRDLTFSAPAGETVALVGESGGGKSTIIGLLLAFYFPTSGSVKIDGIDSRSLNLIEYRSQIAVVPQEVALFNDTVEANIKYGAFDATQDQVIEAAKVAQAHEFIEKLPNGYETVVGERGVKLSVGQKQRVAVARAILRNPRILILDEPTSALDSSTEHALTRALEILMKGRTVFIIAHRLSTVRKANKIMVVQNGSIAETGSHDELMQQNGLYRTYYEQHISLRE